MNRNKRKYAVIMTVYDQAHELESNLPAYLSQEYEPGAEVIVVNESSTDQTEDVLKLLKNDYPQLYTTFLPKPNRTVMRKRLAFSIGTKAAKNEWVIFADINNKPAAGDVLAAMDSALPGDAVLALGYHVKKGIRLQPFMDIQDAECHISKTERILRKVRKRKRMKYMLGRYDFIIIRKDHAYDILKFYEQNIPFLRLMRFRLHIFMKNMFGRASTILLVTT